MQLATMRREQEARARGQKRAGRSSFAVDPRGRARPHRALAPHRSQAAGQARRAVPPSGRDPGVQQPLSARGLSAGGRRARRRLVLTCHWHNWKFDLKTGATIYGGDNLRVYPVKVEDGAVWLDLARSPAAQRVERRSRISTMRWPSTTPPASRASLRAWARRVPGPRSRWRGNRAHARAAEGRDDARLRRGRSVAAPRRFVG